MIRPGRLAVSVFALSLAGLVYPVGLLAQEVASTNGTPMRAFRILEGQRIDLDGSITEDIWKQATAITDFTQQEPVEGGEPSERTEVWVAYDSDKLYIGAIIYDDPAGILAYQKQRDAFLSTDDRFMWILDTFRDGRTGYFFEINANGMMGDALIGGGGGRGGGGDFGGGGGGGGGSNRAWDGIWEVRTALRPDGWSLEVEIPFQTLNFDPASEEWGINFQRTIRRKNEEIYWRGWRRNESLQRPIHAGTLTGLTGLSQGIGLEAIPSTIASWRNIPTNTDPTTYPRDLSLDLNYSVTSSLRASVSINTDFAEVESDQRRVNLTRFPTRFPEQRDFFLEGSGIFSFAPSSGPEPFFSRNIGLAAGQQVPINYGTRMTGQVGRTEVGFYQVGTGELTYFDETDGNIVLPSEQFTVARVRQPFFEQSTIGAIYTRRSTSEDPDGFAPDIGHTAGVDMQLNTRHFMGENNADFEAFFVWNSNPDPTEVRSTGDLSARGFRFNFPNDVWSGHLSYREFGDDYRPTAGFVFRNDFRRIEPRIGWSHRPVNIDWLRKFDVSVQFRNLTELGTGLLEEREWDFNVLGLNFESGDNVSFNVKRVYEYLDASYEISDGIDILAGEYENWEYGLRGNTTGRRKVSIFGGVGWSGFWNGSRRNGSARITLRPNPSLSLSTNFQYNDVTLPQGDFQANLYEVEANLNPTPWVSVTSQVQYDDVSGLVGFFGRLRWIVKPGNDVYLVYTHNWQNLGAGLLDNRDLITLSRGGSIKLNYTYRF